MWTPTWLEILVLVVVSAVSLYLFTSRFRPVLVAILSSRDDPGFRLGPLLPRVRAFTFEVLFQSKVIKERPLPGLAHALVFWGFLAFAFVSAEHLLAGLGVHLFQPENGFRALYSAIAAAFAVLVIVSMTGLAIRRFVIQPKWLGAVSKESALITALIVILMATYLAGWGSLPEASAGWRVNWWIHTFALLIFLPLLPKTKHLHLVLSPAAIFLRRQKFSDIPPLEGEEDFGISTGNDISKIVALQAFSCVECGRCTEHCPANATGKVLDPKKIILGVREYLRDKGPRAEPALVGTYISEEMLWECTSCGACEYQCPVGIQHLPIIIGLRRGLVNTGNWEDLYGSKLFLNVERKGNALGLATSDRDKFIRNAQLPIFDGTQDYCLWLGCMGAYDPQGREIIEALARIFEYLNVTFGVLRKEKCTGDPVRRLGNDLLFSGLAEANLEQLRAVRAVKLISICPHCVQTIAQDWREAGADVLIEHHSEFLARNLSRLPENAAERANAVFHDPCYISRYQGESSAPRQVIDRFYGIEEPLKREKRTFCCGAGGGRAFLGEEEGKRVNVERAEQLVATGASVVVAACPFCNTMLRDGLQQIASAPPPLIDIAQLVAASLPERDAAPATRE